MDVRVGLLTLALVGAGGCQSPPERANQLVAAYTSVSKAAGRDHEPLVTPVSHTVVANQMTSVASDSDPFATVTELKLDRFVAAVLETNPSIPAMVAAWQAAAERYPQAISLDDPMLGVALGPASFGSDEVDFAWMIEAKQKVPWSGKRQWRGEVARAHADVAGADLADARLRLAEAAKLAYLDLFLVRRESEINALNTHAMQDFRTIAHGKYAANLVTQQDVLQADVELAGLSRRTIELERMEAVARARANTLLHRDPEHPLPGLATQLELAITLPQSELLGRLAIERRPDLLAQAARLRAEEAELQLACKEFYPDIEFVVRYDSFWQTVERDLRPQVGVDLNLPLQADRRRAAVREAIARVSQSRAQLELQADEIRLAVYAAAARVRESQRIVQLYAERIIPAATQNVQSAQANYEADKLDFLRLVEAQRQLIGHREQQYVAIADSHRRIAELERAIAGPMPIGPDTAMGSPR